MAIERFVWNNGTESNPVPLTTAMMNKLIAAGNNNEIETSVKGYYKDNNDRSVVKSIVWSLEQLFPDLHFQGDMTNDRFSISTNFNELKENNYLVVNAAGINREYLKFKCVFDDSAIEIDPNDSHLITKEIIKSRFRFQDGILILDAPEENASWTCQFKIKACPIYEDIDTTDNYRLTGQDADGNPISGNTGVITARAIKLEGVAISVPNEMSIRSSVYIQKTPVPATSTKLTQTTYSLAVNPTTAGSFSRFSGEDIFTAGDSVVTAQIVATPTLFDTNLPVSNVATVDIYASKATTIRIDQNVSDPTTMVINPEDCGSRNSENPTNVIHWIRTNSHCYLGKFHNESRGMEIKQLWDRDRNYFDDNGEQGELARIDGTPDPNDGIIADVFLRLPEFYYKTVNELNDQDQETGIVAISFATGKLDDSYIRWDPNTLIGVYEGTIINDGQYDRLYSISGATPKNNYSQDNFKKAARRRNDMTSVTQANRFSLVNYQAHVVMALLYYGYWGGETINCQALLGSGTSSRKQTGGTDGRGMSDTVAAYDGNIGSINFWGLENWWGDLAEWVDDLATANSTGLINILNYNGGVVRQVQSGVTGGSSKCVTKYIFGPDADLIPESVQSSTNWNLNFCDGVSVGSGIGYVAGRGDSGSSNDGGVGRLNWISDDSHAHVPFGSRLLYNGKVTEVLDL